MSFLNANLWFRDVADFERYLAQLSKPSWAVRGITYHNTYSPNETQWAGRASMLSMQHTYETKQPPWDRGPHLYIASGTHYDGIWVMTPPNLEGIHAGDCNNYRWGVEHVHDGQLSPFPGGLLDLGTSAMAALLRYGGIPTPDIVAHRDCMPGRTCPGKYAYDQKQIIINMVRAKLMTTTPNYTESWGPIATPTAESWPWPIPSFWKQHAKQLGKCQSEAHYDVNGQVITQYFAGGYITEVAGKCAMELYPAPIHPVV